MCSAVLDSCEHQRPTRNDLQGLRGWAVIAVAIFHFFPLNLPYGYFGVDVFFVLSGFLIALVLHDVQPFLMTTYQQFYFRRVRRIFPLLLLAVLFVVIYCSSRYADTRLYYQTRSALYALSFTSNLKQSDQAEQYFLQAKKAEDMLTHTWSLAVELQFYLLAPVIILLGKKCSFGDHYICYLSIVAYASFCFSVMSEAPVAFNNVFARLWQFLLGSIVFNLRKAEKSSDEPTSNYHYIRNIFLACTFLSITFVLFFDKINLVMLIQLCITLTAAVTIYINTTSLLLTNPVIVLVGDFSYSFYLLHWPAVCILKEHNVDNIKLKIAVIIACMICSYMIYFFYEKWYTKLNESRTILLVLTLYFANGLALLRCSDSPISRLIHIHTTDKNMTAEIEWLSDPDGNWTLQDFEGIPTSNWLCSDMAREINSRFDLLWDINLQIPGCKNATGRNGGNPLGLCRAPDGKGNLTFMSVGNSYNPNHARQIIKHFRPYYSKLHFFSKPTCLSLEDGTEEYYWCNGTAPPLTVVATIKPDVLFIIQRFFRLDVPIEGPIEKDAQFLMLMNSTIHFAKHTKKLYIMNAFPEPNEDLQKAVHSGQYEQAKILAERVKHSADPIRQRLREVVLRCPKCVLFDIFDAHLTSDGVYMVVDLRTHVNLFEQAYHHTAFGLRMVDSVFANLSSKFSL